MSTERVEYRNQRIEGETRRYKGDETWEVVRPLKGVMVYISEMCHFDLTQGPQNWGQDRRSICFIDLTEPDKTRLGYLLLAAGQSKALGPLEQAFKLTGPEDLGKDLSNVQFEMELVKKTNKDGHTFYQPKFEIKPHKLDVVKILNGFDATTPLIWTTNYPFKQRELGDILHNQSVGVLTIPESFNGVWLK